jgi:hypothetical protein
MHLCNLFLNTPIKSLTFLIVTHLMLIACFLVCFRSNVYHKIEVIILDFS